MKFPKTRIFALCTFMVLSMAVWAVGAQEEKHTDHETLTAANIHEGEKTLVIATTSIITDVVSQIGGERIELKTLVPSGQNPHTYQPNPRQIGDIEKAHLVFINGLGLEEGVLLVVEHNATCPVIEVSHGIDILQNEAHSHDYYDEDEHHHEGEKEHHHDEGENEHSESGHDEDEHHHDHGGGDPHTWTSPVNVLIWVDNIERALIAIDPTHENEYSQSAAQYRKELNSIAKEIENTLSIIPIEQRVIVTDHAAFGYFARDYGFEVVGTILPSFSSNSEASTRHLAELLDILEHEGVNAIFIDSAASDSTRKLAQTLSEESGRHIKILQLFAGTLATAGNEGDTYIGYLRFNSTQLVKGLVR